jgi:hypothetical protein
MPSGGVYYTYELAAAQFAGNYVSVPQNTTNLT